MTTTETAKLIRQELKQLHPEIKFSVRKEYTGVLWVSHSVEDEAFRDALRLYLKKFISWKEFNTDYVFEKVA
jgi:hypothetical protein